MRLLWNEIRGRAARFAEEWAAAEHQKGETQNFSNDFSKLVVAVEEYVRLIAQKIPEIRHPTRYLQPASER